MDLKTVNLPFSWSVCEAEKQLNWWLSINTHTICARMSFCPRTSFAFVKVKICPSDVSMRP